MKGWSWLALAGIGFSLVGHAGTIYKCSGGGREVAYQNFPCTEGQQETSMETSSQPAYAQTPNVKPTGYAPVAQSTPVFVHDPRPAMPFQHAALALGMTDDEVLNLPHWGLPVTIVRGKSNRVWREEWRYASKRLYFENARLIAIEDEAASLRQVASLTAP
jgi:hypothetical protein